jgi:hypothetical protein
MAGDNARCGAIGYAHEGGPTVIKVSDLLRGGVIGHWRGVDKRAGNTSISGATRKVRVWEDDVCPPG